MKHMKANCMLVLAALCGLLFGACYSSPDITWHEPHVYKGKADPLLSELQKGELQQRLKTRFETVQTDR